MSIVLFHIQRLSNAYESLAQDYKKVVDVMGTGKRLLGKYFRVAFFGQVISISCLDKVYVRTRKNCFMNWSIFLSCFGTNVLVRRAIWQLKSIEPPLR